MIKHKIKRRYYFIITTLLVFFIAIVLMRIYSLKTSPKINMISSQYFEKEINYDLTNLSQVMDISSDDILKIYKNDQGEILYVDYDLNASYRLLNDVTKKIKDTLESKEYPNSGLILKLPFFVGSDNVFFTNLGPEISVKISFVNAILANVYTKITNYGLNNALVEAYIKITIDGQIISPVSTKKISTDYDLLISSKVINGRVPEFYGNYIGASSFIFDVPIAS